MLCKEYVCFGKFGTDSGLLKRMVSASKVSAVPNM